MFHLLISTTLRALLSIVRFLARLIGRIVTLRRVLWTSLVLFVALVITIAWITRDLPTAETFAERTIAQSTRLYDRTGETLLYDIHGEEKRTIVPLDAISPLLVNATVVAEDDRFFHHPGIDLPGILRSAYRNLLARRIEQGGSTITQQLVRNAVLTSEKTFARKIREAVLAIAVELRFSKEEILEAYLNQVPYGSLIYGAEAASQTYFGKSVRDITLAEAATLAALPKAPSYYSPYGDRRDELLHRKNYVIGRMLTLGYIGEEEALAAQKEIPEFLPPRDSIIAPHFVFFVQEELEKRFGKDRVEQGGLKVITTIDVLIQEIAEHAVSEGAELNERTFGGQNAALVALDPKTGEILAMVGSRDYFDPAYDGNVNVTTRQRQPGSSFKPIVYATAFERGFTPDTILFDVPTEFSVSGKSYKPKNYTGKTHGPVTARQALANSINIASVKMLWLAGVNETVALAQRLGITTLTDPDRYGLSLVLGGGAVTLLEETSAFGVFAAEGLRAETESILRVEDHKGTVLFEHIAEPVGVLDREVARQITDILSDNAARALIFGTQTRLTLGARPVAAKTGTTQDFRDAWTLGFTPSLVSGVWVGNNDYSPMWKGAAGATVAAPIWNHFMRETLLGSPIESFTPPKPVSTGKPILDGEWAVENIVLIDRASGKRATERTPIDWIEERPYRTVHDTLFWVDRRNPQGGSPENPSADPQFPQWEEAVQQWILENPEILVSVTETPPEDFDDIHVPENKPSVRILVPRKKTRVTESLTLIVEAHAPLGVETVTFTIDDIAFGALEKNTVSGLYHKIVTFTENGAGLGDETIERERELTIRVFDPYGNRDDASISVILLETNGGRSEPLGSSVFETLGGSESF